MKVDRNTIDNLTPDQLRNFLADIAAYKVTQKMIKTFSIPEKRTVEIVVRAIRAGLVEFCCNDDGTVNHAATLLAADIFAVPSSQPTWRTIDSAPKDGTEIDLWSNGRRYTGCKWGRHDAESECPWGIEHWRGLGTYRLHGIERVLTATHWMPQPTSTGAVK